MQAQSTANSFEPRQFLDSLQLGDTDADAFRGIGRAIEKLTEVLHPQRVLELGAGRSPLFMDYSSLPFKFVANDISERELDLLPRGIERARFDISSPSEVPTQLCGAVDLVYSRSVFEHVRSVDDAMKTTHRLLRDGGIALHFFPTLYASPFVINKLIPFWLSEQLVQRIAPPRYERFPARYAQTVATHSALRRWKSYGFRDVQTIRFYGHNYYNKIPLLREIENAFTAAAKHSGWTWYSSFAYVLMVK